MSAISIDTRALTREMVRLRVLAARKLPKVKREAMKRVVRFGVAESRKELLSSSGLRTRTGRLLKGIRGRILKAGEVGIVGITKRAFYGLFHEFGTNASGKPKARGSAKRGLPARPFLEPARPAIEREAQREFEDGFFKAVRG